MAKIYETREDVERERLAQEAQQGRADKKQEFRDILAGSALGIGGFQIESLEKFRAHALREVRPVWHSPLNKFAGYAGLAAAALSGYFFFSSDKKTKAAEAALEKLGPEKVVLPDDIQKGDCLSIAGDTVCVTSVQPSVAASAKSL